MTIGNFGNDPFANNKKFQQLRPAQVSGGTQVAPQQGPGLGQQVAEKAASKAIASQLGTAALTPALGPAAPVVAPLLSEFGGKALGSFLFNEGGHVDDKAKKKSKSIWDYIIKNDNLRDPKHPWSHVGQNKKTLNMGGPIQANTGQKILYPLQGDDGGAPIDPVQGGWNSFDDVKNAFSTGYYGTIPDARAAAPNNPKAQSFVDATDATYASRAAESDPLGLDVQPSANKIAPVGVLGLLGRGLQELGLQNAYGSGALGTNDPVIGGSTPELSSETIAAGTNSSDDYSGSDFSDSGYGASEGADGGVGDFNMGGSVAPMYNPGYPSGYNAGGWVQARMKHLNHGGMAMEDAGMQAYQEMQGMTGEGTTMPGDMMPQGAMDPMADFGYKPSGPLGIKDQMEIDKMNIQRGKATADEARKEKAFMEGERRKEEAHQESMKQKKEVHTERKGPLA